MTDCETCTERRDYYLDAETIQNQQERIAELENAYNMLQSQFDITRERWMRRGECIAKQRERVEELESLALVMYGRMSGCVDYGSCELCERGACAFYERMVDLGLMEGDDE